MARAAEKLAEVLVLPESRSIDCAKKAKSKKLLRCCPSVRNA
jgi:hypothetical protein